MSVADQITDSITQANTKVLGDAPAIALGNLFVATSQALSNAAHNAVNAQQQTAITAQAATTQAIATMLSLDTAATGVATRNLADGAPTALAAVSPAPPEAALDSRTLDAAAFDAARQSPDPMFALMTLTVGALAMIDAVEHLQRAAILSETATALAMTRAMAAPEGVDWQAVIAASDRSLERATEHLDTVCKLAIHMTQQARGG